MVTIRSRGHKNTLSVLIMETRCKWRLNSMMRYRSPFLTLTCMTRRTLFKHLKELLLFVCWIPTSAEPERRGEVWTAKLTYFWWFISRILNLGSPRSQFRIVYRSAWSHLELSSGSPISRWVKSIWLGIAGGGQADLVVVPGRQRGRFEFSHR